MTATIVTESVAYRPIYRDMFKHVPIPIDRSSHPVVPTITSSPNVDMIGISSSDLHRFVVRWMASDPVTADSTLTMRLPSIIEYLPTDDWANLLSLAENGWNIEPVDAHGPETVVQEFAMGVNGIRPTAEVVDLAKHLVQAAVAYTVGPHITVDDEDGDLDIHLRLTDGLIVMANLFLDGTLDASVYDDRQGIPVKTLKRMRRSKKSAEELISLFEKGSCVGTG